MSNQLHSQLWFTQVETALAGLLNDDGPRIVDVGAAGGPSASCRSIASLSDYLAFDPDLRSSIDVDSSGFKRTVILNTAICPDGHNSKELFLTVYPECSSLLEPNASQVRNYAIGNWFEVVGKTTVPTMSLNHAAAEGGMKSIDWLQLDTQGVDLKIIQSLDLSLFSGLLAVEMEPGIAAFYRGESSFTEVCEFMLSSGFWVAKIGQQRFPRLSTESILNLKLPPSIVEKLPGNPFALEFQFFRTIDSWLESSPDERDAAVYWLIAMANGNYGFALELIDRYSRVCEDWPMRELLLNATIETITPKTRHPYLIYSLERFTPPVVVDVLRRLKRKMHSQL